MKYLLQLLLLLATGLACAETSVWEVTGKNQRLYIGGTIHVLSQRDYPLPDAYDRAYASSEHLVFETDLNQIKASGFLVRLRQSLIYEDGNSLKDTLQPATYRELERYCEQSGIPITMLLPLKPPLASLMLTVMELKKIGIDNTGVDQYFNLQAQRDGKKISQLETIEEQLQFLANMAKGHEDEFILSTLEENRQLAELMQSMLSAWRTGDINLLEEQFIKPMQQNFPSVYEQLLVSRNHNWLPLIEQYLSTPEVEFILVGALHLVGNDGLIQQLENSGYRVKQW